MQGAVRAWSRLNLHNKGRFLQARQTRQRRGRFHLRSVIDIARKQGAKMVDVKFVDTFGTWQHFSVPDRRIDRRSLRRRLRF